MTNEDVLEMAKRNIQELDFLKPCTDIRGTIVALAAEVRELRNRVDDLLAGRAVDDRDYAALWREAEELRKDRERLDWLENAGPSCVSDGRRCKWATFTDTHSPDWREVYERESLREAIDAAMKERSDGVS